ncbi:MAG: alpha/beta hydrolase-fold protein, partial [Faecousia sp.]
MEIRYEKHWSGYLNREMEFKIYGSCGKPVLFIPCQAGRFWDFESFHMVDYWAPWIESGKCMVFAIDTIDNEAWAAIGADNRWRIENHEKWYNYVVNEMVPTIKHLAGLANGYDQGILTFGASMGAMHAANLYYRRPDLFDSCFAISGLYDNKLFFGDYCDDLVYNNCPCLY